MEKNIIREKSYKFALKIIILSNELMSRRNFVLSDQLLRSGTSIAANVEEAQGAQSRADFRSKIFISYKEARETRFWLNLISDAAILRSGSLTDVQKEIEEICKLLGSILKSSRIP